MDISETLESAHIYNDDKARRRLNTAPDKVADITLTELHNGVTIERLESLTVPVYQYGTQITIHGIFKDMPSDRVLGYKALFLNQNQSLGVKYVAIDGAKKQLLLNMSRFSKTKWHINIDSEGLKAHRIFWTRDNVQDRINVKECYNSTPDDLYIGGKQAVALMYGGYAVIIGIGAVYQSNLWKLINTLTGIESETEYQELLKADNIKRELESAKYDAEVKANAERKATEMQNAKSSFVAPSNWKRFKGKIETVGTYARIYDTYECGIALQVFKVVKRGAFLCSHTKNFKDFNYVDWQSTDKAHKCERFIDGWVIAETPITPKSKPIVTDVKVDGIAISHNEKLNGIEVKFPNKPSDSVINQLKSLGFRWSYQNMVWYNRYTSELMSKVQNELIGDLCKV